MSRRLLGEGRGIFDFVISGEVIFVTEPMDYIGKCVGKIVLTPAPSPDIYLIATECAGIISEKGGIVSHLAMICLEQGIPAIVGLQDAFQTVKKHRRITMVSNQGRGEVYEDD